MYESYDTEESDELIAFRSKEQSPANEDCDYRYFDIHLVLLNNFTFCLKTIYMENNTSWYDDRCIGNWIERISTSIYTGDFTIIEKGNPATVQLLPKSKQSIDQFSEETFRSRFDSLLAQVHFEERTITHVHLRRSHLKNEFEEELHEELSHKYYDAPLIEVFESEPLEAEPRYFNHEHLYMLLSQPINTLLALNMIKAAHSKFFSDVVILDN
ncbi:chloroperoxidase [Acrasis kona]|uniref:Chloroperoxidase n=1 Tax=Acrasis kona TaxID=1008807 RepID=A0AAW2ZI31_9EUKA